MIRKIRNAIYRWLFPSASQVAKLSTKVAERRIRDFNRELHWAIFREIVRAAETGETRIFAYLTANTINFLLAAGYGVEKLKEDRKRSEIFRLPLDADHYFYKKYPGKPEDYQPYTIWWLEPRDHDSFFHSIDQ